MSLEQIAIDAAFRQFGKAATYIAPDTTQTACTVIRDKRDRDTVFGDSRLHAEGITIEVRASEIPAPAKAGQFVVDAMTYRVISDPESDDPERLVWAMTVAEV